MDQPDILSKLVTSSKFNKNIDYVTPQVELMGITRAVDGASAEEHIERCARECYQSHKGMDPQYNARFLRGLIIRGHESVLEHASASFRVLGGSRAYTHEQVRHRLLSFSQQSQRYVSENNFRAIMPPEIEKRDELRVYLEEFNRSVRALYKHLKSNNIRNEDARFVLPNAVESGIVVSGNLREWRWVVQLRLAPNAQWEIRRITAEILKILQHECPIIFGEYILNESNHTITHISELITPDEAMQIVREVLEQKRCPEAEGKVLKAIGDDRVFQALFHLKRTLQPECKQLLTECGDLK